MALPNVQELTDSPVLVFRMCNGMRNNKERHIGKLGETRENPDTYENFEFEPSSSAGSSAGGRLRRPLGCVLAGVLVVVLLLVLTAHGVFGGYPGGAPSSLARATATSPTSPTSTSSLLPFATPDEGLLQPVPANCSATTHTSSPLTEISYYADPAYGFAPVWVVGFDAVRNQPTVEFGNYPPLPYTSLGWRWRILLVAAPGYAGTVALSVKSVSSGPTSVPFVDIGAGPVTTVILNASQPIMWGVGWAEWPVYIYLPESACYELSAQWPDGSWSIPFAAGF